MHIIVVLLLLTWVHFIMGVENRGNRLYKTLQHPNVYFLFLGFLRKHEKITRSLTWNTAPDSHTPCQTVSDKNLVIDPMGKCACKSGETCSGCMQCKSGELCPNACLGGGELFCSLCAWLSTLWYKIIIFKIPLFCNRFRLYHFVLQDMSAFKIVNDDRRRSKN